MKKKITKMKQKFVNSIKKISNFAWIANKYLQAGIYFLSGLLIMLVLWPIMLFKKKDITSE